MTETNLPDIETYLIKQEPYYLNTKNEVELLKKYKVSEQYKLLQQETYSNLIRCKYFKAMRMSIAFFTKNTGYFSKANSKFILDVFLIYPIGFTFKKLLRKLIPDLTYAGKS